MGTRWSVLIWAEEEWVQYPEHEEYEHLKEAIDVVNHLVNFGVTATIKRKET